MHEVTEALTARLDVTQARTEGSLAVTQGIVVAVYGLDLVEAGPAIYVIHALGVARVDTVVAVAGDDLVVAAATPEAVGPAAALEVVLPAAAPEAVVPGALVEVVVPDGPHEGIVAAGAGEDVRQGFVSG